MNEFRVKLQKGYEVLSSLLEERIRSGELATGARLPSVVELAQAYGVGRSTVREALSALKARGLIDIQHGGGTFVKATSSESSNPMTNLLFGEAKSLQQLLEVRQIVEIGCVALAAKNASSEHIAHLQTIVEQMAQSLNDEALSEDADVRFHVAIAECTHNKILLEVMSSLMHHLQQTIRETRQLWFYGERASAERLLQEHTAIYEAIRERNEGAAVDRMNQHLAKVEAVLRQFAPKE
jgi:GntR family transcriptional repressor for pyruvate dehydrogenase complex